MTYESVYTVKSIGLSFRCKSGLTLYEATKILSTLPRNQFNDSTRIIKVCGSHEVSIAFFCLWTNSIKPFFSCPSTEKKELKHCYKN